MQARWKGRLIVILFALALANLGAVTLMAITMGGLALGGPVADGHYYVIRKHALTEVDRGAWLASFWLCLSVFVTVPSAIIAPLVLSSRKS